MVCVDVVGEWHWAGPCQTGKFHGKDMGNSERLESTRAIAV